MPALANFSIVKNDGTTAITWTGVQPSSGDGTPAVWKSQSVGNAQAHQPELRLLGKAHDAGRKRLLRCTAVYPSLQTDSTTGLTTVRGAAGRFEGSWIIDPTMPQADVDEFVSQVGNCLATSTFRSYLKSGFSAS